MTFIMNESMWSLSHMHVSEFKSHLYASTIVLNLNTQFEKKKKKREQWSKILEGWWAILKYYKLLSIKNEYYKLLGTESKNFK